MANQWLRLWHDMPNDPKWRTISRRSRQPITTVIAAYVHLLVMASIAEERGTIQVNEEDLANALDSGVDSIKAILAAMEGKVIKDNRLIGWNKRQPIKEDGSAERAKAWRENKKRLLKQSNASELQDKDKDKDKDVNTLSYGSERNRMEYFGMFDTWMPDSDFPMYLVKVGVVDEAHQIPDKVLQEFRCFWCGKPDIKKTQQQWQHALAQSYQYMINREQQYGKSKQRIKKSSGIISETSTDLSWWKG